jgi:methionine aminopeptidase
MRSIKPTLKNFSITDVVQQVTKDYSCVPVEGMLSCVHEQNITDGKKRIILNPSPEQRRDHDTETFEEGEVWGVDVLVVTGEDGKAQTKESRTTIYKRDTNVNYQLKMQTSRKVFSEIQKKAGAFPFTLRSLEDEKRARMGVQEAVQHGSSRLIQMVDG